MIGPTAEQISFAMNELDRRISVAPMMDWTDYANPASENKCLGIRK
jgi:hypothetical protein